MGKALLKRGLLLSFNPSYLLHSHFAQLFCSTGFLPNLRLLITTLQQIHLPIKNSILIPISSVSFLLHFYTLHEVSLKSF